LNAYALNAFGFMGLFTSRHDRSISRRFGPDIHLTGTYFIVAHSLSWWAEMFDGVSCRHPLLVPKITGRNVSGKDTQLAAVSTFIASTLPFSAVHSGRAGNAAALCILPARSFRV